MARSIAIHTSTRTALLMDTLQLRTRRDIFFAGQFRAWKDMWNRSLPAGGGVLAAAHLHGEMARAFPGRPLSDRCASYISHADPRRYQPANVAFDLFPALRKRFAIARNARRRFAAWLWKNSTNTQAYMCELTQAIGEFMESSSAATNLRKRCAATAPICASSRLIFTSRLGGAGAEGFRSSGSARVAGSPLRPGAEARHHSP